MLKNKKTQDNKKGLIKDKKGITLIALVVTIIVLLILAGISISMLTGNNGILSNAILAKEEQEKSQSIDEARIAILAEITEKEGEKLTSEEVINILKVYFNNVPEDITDQTQVVTTKNNEYNVELSKILNGVDIAYEDIEYNITFSIELSNSNSADGIEVWSRRYFRRQKESLISKK